jgi:hypothetical protein
MMELEGAVLTRHISTILELDCLEEVSSLAIHFAYR